MALFLVTELTGESKDARTAVMLEVLPFDMIGLMKKAKPSVGGWLYWAAGLAYAAAFGYVAVRSYDAPIYRFYGSGRILLVSILGLAAALLWRKRTIGRGGWALAGALVAVAIASFPDTSRDHLRYLFDGEMIRLWHLSPYVHLPGEFPVDQYTRAFNGIWWVHIPSPYGPLWQALMVGINFVSGNRVVGGVIALKLVNLAGLLVCARYIYLITGKAWTSFLFLVNPIILLDTVATPHTDIVMAAALLAAYYHQRPLGRGVLMGVIGLITAHALIFLPFFSRKWRDFWPAALGTAVTLAVLLLVLRPVVGFDWLAMLRASQGGGVSGTDSLLMYLLLPGASASTVFLASYGLFLIGYCAIAAGFVRRKLTSLDALIFTSLLVPFCLTGVLLPWHFIIPLAFLVLSVRRWAWWGILFFTLLVLRSATSVPELLAMAALFGAGGWVLHRVLAYMARPPRWAEQAMSLLQ